MNDRSASVRQIFDEAAEIASASERVTFLDSACAGDAELRGQVEVLLKAYNDAGGFLDHPAMDAAAFHDTAKTEAFDRTPDNVQSSLTATQAETHADKDEVLGVLAPSTKPGAIGRLRHYEILEVIGKGGFGTVLKAFDQKLHRVVAIKVLSPAFAANGSARARFIREARTAAVVKNEHVVAIHSVEDEAQPPFLVMEIVDGISLQDKLDKKGPLSVKEVLRIGMQIAEGLVAAHKQGLVHRDIKPANILLENGVERVKITDFGLARAVDDASMTQSGTVAGTPMYMSPEQAEGLPIDHRSDLFSLGTVLYAMCTGHPPFRASGTHAVLKRVIDASPRPIREINSEIPEWLCDIIAKLHAKKPEERIQTANEVAELLGARLADVQAGRTEGRQPPVEAPATVAPTTPAPIAQRAAARWTRQRRIAAAAFAMAGVITSYAGLLLLIMPAERVSPPGAQWLVTGLGLALFLAAVLLAFKTWRWRFGAAGALVCGLSVIAYVGRQNQEEKATVVLGGPRHDHLEKVIIKSVEWVNDKVRHDGRHEAVLTQESGLIKPRKASQAELPPGWYEIEVICRPGYVAGKCEITGLQSERDFLGKVKPMLINLKAGDQVLVQVVLEKSSDAKPPQPEPGWVQLFNGKDLDGWRTHPDQPGNWKVENGLLVGRDGPSFLYSRRDDYRDFHFRVKAKINAKGNSGMFFRVPFPASAKEPFYTPPGYEAQIAGPLGSALCTGSLWRFPGPRLFLQNEPLVKENTWFTQEVIAQGKRIIVRLNGETTVDLSDDDGPLVGGLALESRENTTVHFEKVEIKELPPNTSEWMAFFNGKDLTGWKTHRLNPQKWTVEDGALVCRRGQGNSYLFTDKGDFRAFHLRAEVKMSATGQGGVDFGCPFGLLGGEDALIPVSGYRAELGFRYPTGLLSWLGPNNKSLPSAPPKMHEPDQWFDLELIVKDKHVQILVNGKIATDYHDPTFSPLRGNIMLDCRPRKAEPPAEVRFRKIEIKELPASKTPTPAPPLARFSQQGNSIVVDTALGRIKIASRADKPPVTVQRLIEYALQKIDIEVLPAEQPGWVQLFNGKDLTGWVPVARKKEIDPKDIFHIVGNVLMVEGRKDHCLLRSEKAYENYELQFEFRVPPLQKQTAGCLLFLHLQPDKMLGNMLSIDPNGEGFLIGPDRKDFEFKIKGKPPRDGGWNHVHLTCKGHEIGIRFNGEDLGIAKCKNTELRKGFIAILPEFNEVHYRNLRLRALPP